MTGPSIGQSGEALGNSPRVAMDTVDLHNGWAMDRRSKLVCIGHTMADIIMDLSTLQQAQNQTGFSPLKMARLQKAKCADFSGVCASLVMCAVRVSCEERAAAKGEGDAEFIGPVLELLSSTHSATPPQRASNTDAWRTPGELIERADGVKHYGSAGADDGTEREHSATSTGPVVTQPSSTHPAARASDPGTRHVHDWHCERARGVEQLGYTGVDHTASLLALRVLSPSRTLPNIASVPVTPQGAVVTNKLDEHLRAGLVVGGEVVGESLGPLGAGLSLLHTLANIAGVPAKPQGAVVSDKLDEHLRAGLIDIGEVVGESRGPLGTGRDTLLAPWLLSLSRTLADIADVLAKPQGAVVSDKPDEHLKAGYADVGGVVGESRCPLGAGLDTLLAPRHSIQQPGTSSAGDGVESEQSAIGSEPTSDQGAEETVDAEEAADPDNTFLSALSSESQENGAFCSQSNEIMMVINLCAQAHTGFFEESQLSPVPSVASIELPRGNPELDNHTRRERALSVGRSSWSPPPIRLEDEEQRHVQTEDIDFFDDLGDSVEDESGDFLASIFKRNARGGRPSIEPNCQGQRSGIIRRSSGGLTGYALNSRPPSDLSSTLSSSSAASSPRSTRSAFSPGPRSRSPSLKSDEDSEPDNELSTRPGTEKRANHLLGRHRPQVPFRSASSCLSRAGLPARNGRRACKTPNDFMLAEGAGAMPSCLPPAGFSELLRLSAVPSPPSSPSASSNCSSFQRSLLSNHETEEDDNGSKSEEEEDLEEEQGDERESVGDEEASTHGLPGAVTPRQHTLTSTKPQIKPRARYTSKRPNDAMLADGAGTASFGGESDLAQGAPVVTKMLLECMTNLSKGVKTLTEQGKATRAAQASLLDQVLKSQDQVRQAFTQNQKLRSEVDHLTQTVQQQEKQYRELRAELADVKARKTLRAEDKDKRRRTAPTSPKHTQTLKRHRHRSPTPPKACKHQGDTNTRQLFIRTNKGLPRNPVQVLTQHGISVPHDHSVDLHRQGETNAFVLTVPSEAATAIYEASRTLQTYKRDEPRSVSVQWRRGPKDPRRRRRDPEDGGQPELQEHAEKRSKVQAPTQAPSPVSRQPPKQRNTRRPGSPPSAPSPVRKQKQKRKNASLPKSPPSSARASKGAAIVEVRPTPVSTTTASQKGARSTQTSTASQKGARSAQTSAKPAATATVQRAKPAQPHPPTGQAGESRPSSQPPQTSKPPAKKGSGSA